MYIGQAVRTALAMGIDREPSPNTKKDVAQLAVEARTWWCVHLNTRDSENCGR
jgi:hypothetical protein